MIIDYLYLVLALFGATGLLYVSCHFSYVGVHTDSIRPAGNAFLHLKLIHTDKTIARSVIGTLCIPAMVSPSSEIPWTSPGKAQ